MAQNPLIKRYLDAGMAFTQMTQAKAEAIVRDLVKTGEVQANRTEELIEELIERSRRNTEALLDLVRAEVRSQLVSLGLVSEDGEGAEGVAAQLQEHRSPQPPPAPAAEEATEEMSAQAAAGDLPATVVAPAKAVPAKKGAATKGAAKKAAKATGKAGAKKAAAKKTGAKKAGAAKKAAKSAKRSGS